MLKQFYPFPILFLLAVLSACEEKPITIPPLSVGKRHVLVEELTGVRCYNCPDGAAKLAALREQLGENLVVVSIHAAIGNDSPYPESKYDFRTPEGTELANFIGSAIGFPSAAIDRRLLPSEQDIFIGPETAWSGPILEDIGQPPAIGVFLETGFDPVSRQLDVTVNLAPETSLNGEHRLTVVITQDSIQDYQKVGTVKVPDYYHRHVLRRILTQATGNVIAEPLNRNSAISKTFSTTLPVEWNEKHCSVVAFVHRGFAPDKEVLQAAEEPLIK